MKYCVLCFAEFQNRLSGLRTFQNSLRNYSLKLLHLVLPCHISQIIAFSRNEIAAFQVTGSVGYRAPSHAGRTVKCKECCSREHEVNPRGMA